MLALQRQPARRGGTAPPAAVAASIGASAPAPGRSEGRPYAAWTAAAGRAAPGSPGGARCRRYIIFRRRWSSARPVVTAKKWQRAAVRHGGVWGGSCQL